VFGSVSISERRATRLEIRDLTVRIPSRAAPVLRDVSLELTPGTVGGLLGPSGSGKTTLLHTVSGLVPWMRTATVNGKVELDGETLNDLDPGQRAHLVASCLDRARAQLFLATPRQEIAAATKLYGESPLTDEAIEVLRLRPLLDRKTTELSSGERQKLALAVALSGCPRPVLLDEPTAHLDRIGAEGLRHLLIRARELGGSVVLAEQAGWRLNETVDRWWSVVFGDLDEVGAPLPPTISTPHHRPGTETVLELQGVAVDRDGRQLLTGVDLELRSGEIVLLTGPNGSGKSTLAEVATGFRPAAAGRLTGASDAALMLPTAELQLFATTVEGEVAARGGGFEAQARVLRRHRLEHLAARAPWTLSRGERQRLVHAAIDVQRPPVMVVDEPAQGLDPDEIQEFVGLIHRRAERGRAYLIISHRDELAAAAHRHLRVADGRLVTV
jgi:energy-coupling factor transport system ATP-binding protein